jgi:hypothetical protein
MIGLVAAVVVVLLVLFSLAWWKGL